MIPALFIQEQMLKLLVSYSMLNRMLAHAGCQDQRTAAGMLARDTLKLRMGVYGACDARAVVNLCIRTALLTWNEMTVHEP